MTFDYPLSKQDQFITFNDRLRELAPEVATALRGLREAADAHGPLDAKQRELIALAVAVTVRCDGCIAVHTTEALKQGATKE